MICPRYKERVIGALILKAGNRALRRMLEIDKDLERIIQCDGRSCAEWATCGARVSSRAFVMVNEGDGESKE